MTYLNRAHLLALADRCEAGAEQLTYEGEHAAEVLAERAGGALADPQEWAARKTAAAAAARQYAQNHRAEADTMSDSQPVPEPRIREAEKVADAANLGGILIDGRPMAERSATSSWTSPEAAQASREYEQAKADTIERTGVFEHVADDGQVPFWQLATPTVERQPDTSHTDSDGPATSGSGPAPRPDTNAADDVDGF